MSRPCRIAAWALLLAFSAALVYLNLISPLWGDDYVYLYVFDARYYFDESFSRLVSSWQDILDSQLAHYRCTNGRFAAHTLAQGFLAWGRGWPWALLNTLCLVANAWLIWRFTCRRPGEGSGARWQGFLLTLGLYWLFLPHPGQLFFWLTGSCNYQWAALFVLAFLNLLFLPAPRALAWLLCPVAFLAGNGNEALSLGLALALAGYALWKRRALGLRWFAGLACFFLGTASNVFSPGVAARMEMAGEGVAEAELWTRCVNAVEDIGKVLADWPSLLLVPLAALLISLLPCGRSQQRSFLLPAALLSLGLAVCVRMIDPRATFGGYLYAFMLALPVVLTLFDMLPRWVRALGGGALALCVGMGLLNAAYDIPRFEAYERSLVEAARAGERCVLPQADAPYSPYNHSSFLIANRAGMHNRALAAWFGVPRFGVFKPWEMDLLHSVAPAAYESLRQPGEYCRANENVFLIRLPQEPTSCLVTGCQAADDEHAEPRCCCGFSTAVVEKQGAHYLLIFFTGQASEEDLAELRLRLIEGHSWHILSLDPRQDRGVMRLR